MISPCLYISLFFEKLIYMGRKLPDNGIKFMDNVIDMTPNLSIIIKTKFSDLIHLKIIILY